MQAEFFSVLNLPRGVVGAAAALLALMLGGCSAPLTGTAAGLECVQDSPNCIEKRASALSALTAAKDRAWVRQPATAKAYASGVRLFALRNSKSELTCAELALGQRESAGARTALRAPGAGLTPAQISRATLLAGEVGRELAAEARRRCKN